MLIIRTQFFRKDLFNVPQSALWNIACLHPVGKRVDNGQLCDGLVSMVAFHWLFGAFEIVDLYPSDHAVLEFLAWNFLRKRCGHKKAKRNKKKYFSHDECCAVNLEYKCRLHHVVIFIRFLEIIIVVYDKPVRRRVVLVKCMCTPEST